MITNLFRYFLFLVIASTIFSATSFSQKKFDVILLKSGGKVVGTILEKHENKSVTIQLQSEDQLTIKWSEIESFDVLVVQEKSVEEKLNEEFIEHADLSWRVIYGSGDQVRATKLDSLSGTCLFVNRRDKSISIPIDSIAVLTHYKEGHFWTGAGIGLVTGTLLGALIGGVSYQAPEQQNSFGVLGTTGKGFSAVGTGIVIGAPLGFLTGGIIGGSEGHETFDLRTCKDLKTKRLILLQALED